MITIVCLDTHEHTSMPFDNPVNGQCIEWANGSLPIFIKGRYGQFCSPTCTVDDNCTYDGYPGTTCSLQPYDPGKDTIEGNTKYCVVNCKGTPSPQTTGPTRTQMANETIHSASLPPEIKCPAAMPGAICFPYTGSGTEFKRDDTNKYNGYCAYSQGFW